MFTAQERAFLARELIYFYRSGVLGLSSLSKGLWHLCRRRKNTRSSRTQTYIDLYTNPSAAIAALYENAELSFGTWKKCAVAWLKFCIRRNRIPRDLSGTPYPFFYAEFLDHFEAAFAAQQPPDETVQRDFLRVCAARAESKFFFPMFLSTAQSDKWKDRFLHLLAQVELPQLLTCDIPPVFRRYFLAMRINGQLTSLHTGHDGIAVYAGQTQILQESAIRIVFHTIRLQESVFRLSAIVKAGAFQYMGIPKLYAICNEKKRVELSLSESCTSYDQSFEKTALYFAFRFSCDPAQVRTLSFQAILCGVSCPVQCEFAQGTPLSGAYHSFIRERIQISFVENRFTLTAISSQAQMEFQRERLAFLPKRSETYLIRTKVAALEQEHTRIWLYSDYVSVSEDNGLYQFLHDIENRDGIMRYYISGRSDTAHHPLIPEHHRTQIVPFGSLQHKIYFLAAEKILAAFVDAPQSLIPFSPEAFTDLSDLYHAQIIYLQHGILHAHIPWRYAPVSPHFHADQIVISSAFERRNMIETYHFSEDQLIAVGMPRYDVIVRKRANQGKILFAPSWRAHVQDVTQTAFWDGIIQLVQSPQLHTFLEEHDLLFELKLHPMLAQYGAQFASESSRVQLKTDTVHPEEYDLFLTDFSSYVFDFVYLSIPVIYYFPDVADFIAGRYQYRQLDLPLEQGFGRLLTQPDAAVDEIIRIAKNHFVPDPVYQKRMQEFFLPLHDCREQLYRRLIQ